MKFASRIDLRNHLDQILPFLGAEGRLEEAATELWIRVDAPGPDGDGWDEFLDALLGEDGNGIYDLIGGERR